MSIYSELLRLALAAQEEEDPSGDISVDELVDRLATCAVRLARRASADGSQAGDLTANLIEHDVALVRLCEQFEIPQSLTDPLSSPGERDRLIALLAEKKIDFAID